MAARAATGKIAATNGTPVSDRRWNCSGLNNAAATFKGPDLGHDSLIVEANLGVQITPRIATIISYDGKLAWTHYISNALGGTVSLSF